MKLINVNNMLENIFTQEEISLIQTSFLKICESDCWEIHYKRLFELDPDAIKLFKGDIKDQQHRIMTMMKTVVEGLNNPQIIIPAVQELGKRHYEYNVRDEDYELFKESLLYAIEKVLGDEFTPDLKSAWNKFYDVLADIMKSSKY